MQKQAVIWLNNDLLPVSQARVSVEDRGFLYGDGFFETLRAENGRPLFLEEHVKRLRASAEDFRLSFPTGFPWEKRLQELLAANGLLEGLAAVKILLTRGEAAGLGLPAISSPTLVIYARPFVPPSPQEYANGWPVAVFPERRTTFIGRHKSLNYLFYLAARQYALDHDAREALVLEADGSVSEGAATSLVLLLDDRLVFPAGSSALPGVTVAVLARALRRRGERLEQRDLKLSQVKKAAGFWLANSLLGLMPVSSLDQEPVVQAPEMFQMLQECLAQEAGR
jgi:branched-chain amino acid aminotransferase